MSPVEEEKSTAKAAVADDLSIGQLLLNFSLITKEQLREALGIAKQTKLALGKVLVITQDFSESLLQAALQCQTMLREKQLDLSKAHAAIQLVQQGAAPDLNEALRQLGYTPPSPVRDLLTDLIKESGLVSDEHLALAKTQMESTGLPLGRVLVLSGNLSESMLAAVLNVQAVVQSGKINLEEAVKSLSSVHQRTLNRSPRPGEKDFYSLPGGESTLLGELMIQAGCLTKDQLKNALELGVMENRPLGEMLQSMKLVSRELVQKSLDIQQLLLTKSISHADAVKLLVWVDREQISVEEGRQRLEPNTEPVKSITLVEFATMLGILSDLDVENAIGVAMRNSQLMLQILLFSESKNEHALRSAAACISLIERGKLTLEHACVLYDYARKRELSIEVALSELNWYQGELPTEVLSSQGVDFEVLRTKAEQSFSEGRLEDAEKQWLEVVGAAEKFGSDHPNLICSMERLADVYCQAGKMEQAESVYSRALVAKARVLPANSLHIATTVNNLAKVSYFLSRFDDAERFAKQFLEIYQANFPPDHPDVACALQNLSTLYHMQEKYTQAEPYYAKALQICRESLGLNHPTTVRLRRNYARLLRSLNRESEAQELDPAADGALTGSWTVISIPAEQSLKTEE